MQEIALLLRVLAGCLDLVGTTLHAGRDVLESAADRAEPDGPGIFTRIEQERIRQAEQRGEGQQ